MRLALPTPSPAPSRWKVGLPSIVQLSDALRAGERHRERQTGARARLTDYIFAVTILPRARKKTQNLF